MTPSFSLPSTVWSVDLLTFHWVLPPLRPHPLSSTSHRRLPPEGSIFMSGRCSGARRTVSWRGGGRQSACSICAKPCSDTATGRLTAERGGGAGGGGRGRSLAHVNILQQVVILNKYKINNYTNSIIKHVIVLWVFFKSEAPLLSSGTITLTSSTGVTNGIERKKSFVCYSDSSNCICLFNLNQVFIINLISNKHKTKCAMKRGTVSANKPTFCYESTQCTMRMGANIYQTSEWIIIDYRRSCWASLSYILCRAVYMVALAKPIFFKF